MRYSKEHKLQTRNRIVKNASHSLRQKGVDGVSVADLMKLAGLTHGGFYSHFDSREALVVESFALVIDQTASRWLDLTKGIPAANRFDAIVKAYLSPRHRDNSGHGCALPAMGADIARSSEKVRGTFAKQLEKLIDVLACQLSGISTEQARQIATGAIQFNASAGCWRATKHSIVHPSLRNEGSKGSRKRRIQGLRQTSGPVTQNARHNYWPYSTGFSGPAN